MKLMRIFFVLLCLITAIVLPFTSFHVSRGHLSECPIVQVMGGGCIGEPNTPQGAAGYVHVLTQIFVGVLTCLVVLTFLIGWSSPMIDRLNDPPKRRSEYNFRLRALKITRHLYSFLDRWLATGIYNQRDTYVIA